MVLLFERDIWEFLELPKWEFHFKSLHQGMDMSFNSESFTWSETLTPPNNKIWLKPTGILSFNPRAKATWQFKKANASAIQKAIAKAGHDTEKFKAPDKVYKQLPECCLYRE